MTSAAGRPRRRGGWPLGGGYRPQTNLPFGNATITFPTTMDANIAVNGLNFTVTGKSLALTRPHPLREHGR
jgi:hypothetical protein